MGTSGTAAGIVSASAEANASRQWNTVGAVTGLFPQLESLLEANGWLQATSTVAGELKVRYLQPTASYGITIDGNYTATASGVQTWNEIDGRLSTSLATQSGGAQAYSITVAPYATLVFNSTSAAVTYSFTLDGVAKTYAAAAGASWATVASGITAAIGADYTVDSTVTNQLRISKNNGGQVVLDESMPELSLRNTLRVQSLTSGTPPVVTATSGSLLETSLATTGTVTVSQPINRVALDLGSIGVLAQAYGLTVSTRDTDTDGNISASVSALAGRQWSADFTAPVLTGSLTQTFLKVPGTAAAPVQTEAYSDNNTAGAADDVTGSLRLAGTGSISVGVARLGGSSVIPTNAQTLLDAITSASTVSGFASAVSAAQAVMKVMFWVDSGSVNIDSNAATTELNVRALLNYVAPGGGSATVDFGAVAQGSLFSEIKSDLEQGGWLAVSQLSTGGLEIRHLSPGTTNGGTTVNPELTLTQTAGATLTSTAGTKTVTDTYRKIDLTGSGTFRIGSSTTDYTLTAGAIADPAPINSLVDNAGRRLYEVTSSGSTTTIRLLKAGAREADLVIVPAAGVTATAGTVTASETFRTLTLGFPSVSVSLNGTPFSASTGLSIGNLAHTLNSQIDANTDLVGDATTVADYPKATITYSAALVAGDYTITMSRTPSGGTAQSQTLTLSVSADQTSWESFFARVKSQVEGVRSSGVQLFAVSEGAPRQIVIHALNPADAITVSVSVPTGQTSVAVATSVGSTGRTVIAKAASAGQSLVAAGSNAGFAATTPRPAGSLQKEIRDVIFGNVVDSSPTSDQIQVAALQRFSLTISQDVGGTTVERPFSYTTVASPAPTMSTVYTQLRSLINADTTLAVSALTNTGAGATEGPEFAALELTLRADNDNQPFRVSDVKVENLTPVTLRAQEVSTISGLEAMVAPVNASATLTFSNALQPAAGINFSVNLNGVIFTRSASDWTTVLSGLKTDIELGNNNVTVAFNAGAQSLTITGKTPADTFIASASARNTAIPTPFVAGDKVLITEPTRSGNYALESGGSLTVVALRTNPNEVIELKSQTGDLVVVDALNVGSGGRFLSGPRRAVSHWADW